jgi:hypothetical protein
MVRTAKTPLTTVSGKFYVGMTQKMARDKDLYKSKFSRDFTDIDKDGNGILDEREICNERDLECSRGKVGGEISMMANTAAVGFSLMTAPLTAGGSLFLTGLGTVGNCAMAKQIKDMESEQNITDKYRQEHHLDKKG